MCFPWKSRWVVNIEVIIVDILLHWASEGGLPPLDFKNFAKKDLFQVGTNKSRHFCPPLPAIAYTSGSQPRRPRVAIYNTQGCRELMRFLIYY